MTTSTRVFFGYMTNREYVFLLRRVRLLLHARTRTRTRTARGRLTAVPDIKGFACVERHSDRLCAQLCSWRARACAQLGRAHEHAQHARHTAGGYRVAAPLVVAACSIHFTRLMQRGCARWSRLQSSARNDGRLSGRDACSVNRVLGLACAVERDDGADRSARAAHARRARAAHARRRIARGARAICHQRQSPRAAPPACTQPHPSRCELPALTAVRYFSPVVEGEPRAHERGHARQARRRLGRQPHGLHRAGR